jgi:hypothetical protein
VVGAQVKLWSMKELVEVFQHLYNSQFFLSGHSVLLSALDKVLL